LGAAEAAIPQRCWLEWRLSEVGIGACAVHRCKAGTGALGMSVGLRRAVVGEIVKRASL
jgi:hypothetical protein